MTRNEPIVLVNWFLGPFHQYECNESGDEHPEISGPWSGSSTGTVPVPLSLFAAYKEAQGVFVAAEEALHAAVITSTRELRKNDPLWEAHVADQPKA